MLLLPGGLDVAASYFLFHHVLIKSRQWEYFSSTRFDDDVKTNRSTLYSYQSCCSHGDRSGYNPAPKMRQQQQQNNCGCC